MFIDYAEIKVTAGSGGPGCISFRREKFISKGGPNGGDGGRGGDIVFIADANISSLLDFRYKNRIVAENGSPGGGSLKSGRSGKSVVVKVPQGTIIKNMETGQILADLDENNKEVVIARGGRGGHGNDYYKSSTNQTPRRAEDGRAGESFELSLELKLLADVGLVGLPNAGKSTMLSILSDAHPKIADYPFTTLIPNLGIVRLRDFKSFVMADIPGIIEGASHGKGLGIQFLKHIQRTRLIIYLIDIFEGKIEETLSLLKTELADFDKTMLQLPFIVVLNKIDLIDKNTLNEILKIAKGDYITFSGVTGSGKEALLSRIEHELDRQK
jgi:GTP-binding protein